MLHYVYGSISVALSSVGDEARCVSAKCGGGLWAVTPTSVHDFKVQDSLFVT